MKPVLKCFRVSSLIVIITLTLAPVWVMAKQHVPEQTTPNFLEVVNPPGFTGDSIL